MARESRDPQRSESLLSSAMVVMTAVIPEDIYDAVPRLPRLYRYLLPVKEPGVLVPRLYVFVLQESLRKRIQRKQRMPRRLNMALLSV